MFNRAMVDFPMVNGTPVWYYGYTATSTGSTTLKRTIYIIRLIGSVSVASMLKGWIKRMILTATSMSTASMSRGVLYIRTLQITVASSISLARRIKLTLTVQAWSLVGLAKAASSRIKRSLFLGLRIALADTALRTVFVVPEQRVVRVPELVRVVLAEGNYRVTQVE